MTNGFIIAINKSLLACPKGNHLFRFRSYLTIVFLALALLIVPVKAIAIPSAEFLYTETDLGGGWWQYDYTLYNTSYPVADAGDIYDVAIYFDPSATFVGSPLPAGWDNISWEGVWVGFGFAEAFSLNPGAPPLGTDVAPGTSLGGFSFQIDYQAGDIFFDVYITNPSDSGNPVLYGGLSAPVPEPGTIILLGSGFTLLIGYGRLMAARRKKRVMSH